MADRKNENDIENKLQQAAHMMAQMTKECTEVGKTYEFTCPECGAVLYASKNAYNGHLHAACSKCDFYMME